jgi:non-ribosomal peptide synthetase component F
MIVAIYGVLKAGAGYVPLDPDNPVERNQFICKDVNAKIIITSGEYASVFQSVGKSIVMIDQIIFSGYWPNIDHHDLTPDNLAYVIYTSGSTGIPKGVLVSHKSVASMLKSRVKAEGYQPHWRSLLFSNYVFDASVGDIFTVLSTGELKK